MKSANRQLVKTQSTREIFVDDIAGVSATSHVVRIAFVASIAPLEKTMYVAMRRKHCNRKGGDGHLLGRIASRQEKSA